MTLDLFAYMDRPNQLGLFDKKDKLDVEAFFASLTEKEIEEHKRVWRELRCRNQNDKLLRWLFAFCSVHTTYQNNMMGYEMIRNWYEWINRPDALKERISLSGMGLTNVRTKFLTHFILQYWERPSFYEKGIGESWTECRDRLVESILGLGKAKVSFALEMIYTEEAKVFCADTHLFQAYGLNQASDEKRYEEIERHWITLSNAWNVPSAIARAIYWNRKKGEPNCMYWAKVFLTKVGH